MPISATCPHGPTPHRLADDLDGRRIRCKECGEPFRVGGGRRDDYDDRPRQRRRSSSLSSSLVLLMVIGVVFGVGVTIVGGAAVWYLMSGRNPRGGPRIAGQQFAPRAIVPPNRPG